MNKETEDALHMLLHCSLKDTEYETQFEQYKIVRNYITNLQQENKQLKERIEYLERSNNRREDTILEQRQEIRDLEDNWNKLKQKMIDSFNESQDVQFLDVLQDMQELEQGSDE